MKFVLFVMSERGWAVLAEMAQVHKEAIQFVVSSRNTDVVQDYFDEIEGFCKNNDIEFFDRKENFSIGSAVCIAAGWRWMIRDLDDHQLIVAHDSLLPSYRGFAPVVNMLIRGVKTLGVTLLFGNSRYDSGDIIQQEMIEIEYPITIFEAYKMLCPLYATVVRNTVNRLVMGKPVEGIPQNEREATYSLWRDTEDYRIDFQRSAAECRRFVDAVGFPFKGASCRLNFRDARILECEEVPDVSIENRDVGKVIWVEGGCPVVVCGVGLLKLKRVVFDDDGESALPIPQFRVRFS